VKTVLHAGCGLEHLPPYLSHCSEVRLDIDPAVKPDIVANMAALPDGIGPYDAVYTCHSLEHLYPYDVLPCLEGFLRVLKTGGVAIVLVPDLEDVPPTDDVLYTTVGGTAVTGLDMYYGLSCALKDMPYMAHHCGFVEKTLREVMQRAGFKNVVVHRQSNDIIFRSLVGIGEKP
jgi:ubiquinone/menaquinone biosynthesis C-methylase UbiE